MIHLAKRGILFLFSLIFAASCQKQKKEVNTITPPTAKKITEQLKKHGDVRIDDYYWLNDRENPEVISYLEEEAAYLKFSYH